jgi:U3 small nucleolar RNA-associated protein 18
MSSNTKKRQTDTNREEILAKKLFTTNAIVDALQYSESSSDEGDEEKSDVEDVKAVQAQSSALWHDEDDDVEDVSSHQKQAFIVASKAKWAQGTKDDKIVDSDDEDDEAMGALYSLTRTTGKVTTTAKNLTRTYIKCDKTKDITLGHNGNGPIVNLAFHPSRPVLMTCGQRSTKIAFFEVCNSMEDVTLKKSNHFLQDVSFPDYEVASVDFWNYGQSVFVGSVKRPYFYSYDLADGKINQISRPRWMPQYNYGKFAISDDGSMIAFLTSGADVFVCELKTMAHIQTFAAAAKVVDVKFAPGDKMTLFGFAQNGAVYIWDLYSPQKQTYFFDDGCVGPRTIAVSKNGQFIATGTDTAIVNVYDRVVIDSLENGTTAKPLWSATNLTTKITKMSFNHDAQLLAFISPVKKMAYRLLHMNSGTVYKNFPPKQEMLERELISSVEFSPKSGYVAFGTMTGHCRLYRLHAFSEY